MGTPPHATVLTRLATRHLRPAGLVRRGRSRTWLDDHGWWVGVLALQPSGFSRGTHLDVGVTWPFHVGEDDPDLSLAEPVRVGGFVPFETDVRFARAVEGMLRDGLEEVGRRRRALATPAHAAAAADAFDAGGAPVGWDAWDAACLHGLAGHGDRASELFGFVASSDDDRAWWRPVRERAGAWGGLVGAEPDRFRAELRDVIRATRTGLGLEPAHPELAAVLP